MLFLRSRHRGTQGGDAGVLPSTKPTAVGGMSREQLDAELMKGVESMRSGKTYTADEVDAELNREFGI